MSSCEWSHAPDWANWYAVDGDDSAYFYENKPESCDDGLKPYHKYWEALEGQRLGIGYAKPAPQHWDLTLEARPDDIMAGDRT